MKIRFPMIYAATGMSLSWLIAQGWGNQESPAEPASSEALSENTPPPEKPPADAATPIPPVDPVDDFAPEKPAPTEAPAEAAAEKAVPVPPEEPEGFIPTPDEVPLPNGYPLVPGQEAGVVDPSVAAGSSLADLENSQVEAGADSLPPAENLSAPWVAASGGFTGYSSGASGQWVLPPSGFSNIPPAFLSGGASGGVLDGFSLAATLSGTYDTNPSQGFTGPATSDQSDYFVTLGGGFAYATKAREWTFGANYNGSYNQYFNQSELSGYNQSAGASAQYNGGPLQASLSLNAVFGSGANRFYASVVDEIIYNYRLSARYKISAKTSLTGDISQNLTTASGGAVNEQSAFNLGIAALWRYSSLTEFGPGIRYTSDGSDAQLGRSSIGPTLTVNYKLSSKVSMNSRVGMDFAQFDDGTSADPTLSISAGLNYEASRLWGMSLSLYRDAQADVVTPNAFTTLTSLRIGVHRKLGRATLNLGLGYQTNVFETSNTAPAGARSDQDFLTLDSALGMPILANTTMASVFLRHQNQSGGSQASWDSTQMGFSLSRSF